jgi:hypothetical protein
MCEACGQKNRYIDQLHDNDNNYQHMSNYYNQNPLTEGIEHACIYTPEAAPTYPATDPAEDWELVDGYFHARYNGSGYNGYWNEPDEEWHLPGTPASAERIEAAGGIISSTGSYLSLSGSGKSVIATRPWASTFTLDAEHFPLEMFLPQRVQVVLQFWVKDCSGETWTATAEKVGDSSTYDTDTFVFSSDLEMATFEFDIDLSAVAAATSSGDSTNKGFWVNFTSDDGGTTPHFQDIPGVYYKYMAW